MSADDEGERPIAAGGGAPRMVVRIAIHATVLLIAWGVYWVAFFPGVVGFDSIGQWRQIVTGRYNDWHPAFHTGVVWLLTRPGHSFASMSLVQVLVASLLVACFLSTCRDLGAPRWLICVALAWLALAPVFAMNVITVWKDTAFALAVMWMTLLVLRALARETVGLAAAGWLGLAGALACLFRHNGAAVVLPTFAAFAWWFRHRAPRALAVAAAVCLLAVWIVKGPAYRAAHVRRVPRALPYQTLIHEVGAFVATGTPLTAEERAFLERALPLSTWRATYACASGNALMRSGMQPDALLHDPFSLPVLWVRLALRDPWTLLHHWSCATRFVWSPRSDLSVACDVTPNPFGIAARPLVPGAERLLAGVVRATLVPDSLLRVLVWQPALPLYAVLAALAASLRRARSTTPVLVFLPALCNTLVWLVLPFAPDSRFQWPVTLFAPVALCLAALDWRRVGGAAGA